MGSRMTITNPVNFNRSIASIRSKIKDIVLKDIKDHFKNEEDATGKKWAALKDPFANHPILHKTGILENSITVEGQITNGEITLNIRAGAPYAMFHELGTGNIPQRSFMQLSKYALYLIEEELGKLI